MFNDTKDIILATYVTSVVTTVIIFSTYTMEQLANTFAAVSSFSLFVGTTVILGLVFIPPVSSSHIKLNEHNSILHQ